MKSSVVIFSLCSSVTLVATNHLPPRDGCANGYTICSPPGAITTQVPQLGDSVIQNLFVDLVGSSLPDGNKRAHFLARTDPESASLCCISSLTCLTMSNLQIPFCYDRFTTNYYLPDGSYGMIVGGSYTTSSGDSANLLSGEYTLKDGSKGNIYDSNEAAKPNTASLHLPAQFTAQGVGTAIPASALGSVVTMTYTTTLPGTTILPKIIPGSTRSEQIVGGSVILGTTQTSILVGSTVVSVESATTQTILIGGYSPVSVIIPATTFSRIFADSTAVSAIPASTASSTVPGTTIQPSTVSGTTIAVITSTLITIIHASNTQNTNGVSSAVTATAAATSGGSTTVCPLKALAILVGVVFGSFSTAFIGL